MKTKNFLMIAVSAFVLHVSVMGYMIINREITLRIGEQFIFRTAPVDPHDVFRGKFLRVDVQGDGPFTNKLECRRGQKLYAPLSVDADGLAFMTDISVKPPKGVPFIKTECIRCQEEQVKTGVVETNFMYYCKRENDKHWRWYNQQDVAKYNLTYTKVNTNKVDQYKYTGKYITSIKVPFDRYYLDEKLSSKADLAYRDSSRNGRQDARLKVRVRKGYALIESLEINGTPIRELVKDEK